MKNHYLMVQIADMVKQLYEWFFLKKNEIKKKQKNISSELLASFGRQLTRYPFTFQNCKFFVQLDKYKPECYNEKVDGSLPNRAIFYL